MSYRFFTHPCKFSIYLGFLLLILASQAHALTPSLEITRESVDIFGREMPVKSLSLALSGNGQYVLYRQESTVLPGRHELYLRNRISGEIETINLSSAGTPSDTSTEYDYTSSFLSNDGRFVLFHSSATNLVTGDTNRVSDVFLRDRKLKTTERVSVGTTGGEANSYSTACGISNDGRYVAFVSAARNLVFMDTNSVTDIFVRDRLLRKTERVSVSSLGVQSNGPSRNCAISGNGSYVVFDSDASNLVAGDSNGKRDVFIYNRLTKTTERISVDSVGNESNDSSIALSISNDGNRVVFLSEASNLVPGDGNRTQDAFVYDRLSKTTERISVNSAGIESDALTWGAWISGNGNHVVFLSTASNLSPTSVAGQSDVYLRDIDRKQTLHVSRTYDGRRANNPSFMGYAGSAPIISDSGEVVAFSSYASNLIANDTNGVLDVFTSSIQIPPDAVIRSYLVPLPYFYCFDAIRSDSVHPITEYNWSFGDGGSTTSASADTVCHAYSGGGNYTVTLQVIDSKGQIGSQTEVISFP